MIYYIWTTAQTTGHMMCRIVQIKSPLILLQIPWVRPLIHVPIVYSDMGY